MQGTDYMAIGREKRQSAADREARQNSVESNPDEFFEQCRENGLDRDSKQALRTFGKALAIADDAHSESYLREKYAAFANDFDNDAAFLRACKTAENNERRDMILEAENLETVATLSTAAARLLRIGRLLQNRYGSTVEAD